MIALDTNVLIRLLLADDRDQATSARRLISTMASPRKKVFVSIVVLAEACWTLRKRYQKTKRDVAAFIATLLADDRFAIEHVERVEVALRAWRVGKADFADYLIALAARDAGATTTFTFDTDAATSPGFTLVPA